VVQKYNDFKICIRDIKTCHFEEWKIDEKILNGWKLINGWKVVKMGEIFSSILTTIHPYIYKFRVYGLHCYNKLQYWMRLL
jgi:hypothetical protein